MTALSLAECLSNRKFEGDKTLKDWKNPFDREVSFVSRDVSAGWFNHRTQCPNLQ